MIFNKENLILTLKNLPEIIEKYFQNMPEGFFDIRRGKDSWTIREHLYHLVSVQDMLYGRVLKIKKEKHPVITSYFPDKVPDNSQLFESIDHAISVYKEVRKKQISLFEELNDDDFEREAEHDEYIKYNIPIIMNHLIFHEYWHMYRIEELWLTKDEYFVN